MALVLPHKFKDAVGETASGVQVLENDEALKTAIEAAEATLAEGKSPVKVNGSVATVPQIQTWTSNPTCGVTNGFAYTESGIAFPTACFAAWLGGWFQYTDAGKTAPGTQPFGVKVEPQGKNVVVAFNNGYPGNVTLFPSIFIVALGR